MFTATHLKTLWLSCFLRSDSAVLPIKKKVFGQPLRSYDLEDDFIGLQGLAVDPARQGRVEALGQPFAYRQLLGNHLVFCIIMQNLRQDLKTDS